MLFNYMTLNMLFNVGEYTVFQAPYLNANNC